jgi:hypothetical protein
MSTIYSLLDSPNAMKDPLVTKKILESLSPYQNQQLDAGRPLLNPITGDMIVPIVTQNQIAKIIVNIF